MNEPDRPLSPLSMPDLHDLQPDPLAPRPADVERYVEALQELAKRNPAQARRHAWDQIRLAAARATGPTRDEAAESLGRMFRLGLVPEPPLDGPYRGLIVATLTARAADPLLRQATQLWQPWEGKRFDAGSETGDNLLLRSARMPARLLWPSYRLEEADSRLCAGFRFVTSPGPDALNREQDVLRLDYAAAGNPRPIVRDVLDEVVQIVPGAYLGRILLRRGGRLRLVGWFALEPPETVRLEEPASAAESKGTPFPLPA
jgi:hypothetical protein